MSVSLSFLKLFVHTMFILILGILFPIIYCVNTEADHIDMALIKILNFFTGESEDCLILKVMQNKIFEMIEYQTIVYNGTEVDLSDIIAKGSPCSILIYNDNSSEKFNNARSKIK